MADRATLLLSILLCSAAPASAQYDSDKNSQSVKVLCPGSISNRIPRVLIISSRELDPGLNDIEKRLVCGEPIGKKSLTGGAWAKIPLSQAKYNLTNFLQKRGYHHPSFFSAEAGGTLPELRVELGP